MPSPEASEWSAVFCCDDQKSPVDKALSSRAMRGEGYGGVIETALLLLTSFRRRKFVLPRSKTKTVPITLSGQKFACTALGKKGREAVFFKQPLLLKV
ncbi:hypothetical protein AVEN_80408-1 [Araneus ventricosus]|uniref:Uncharacterized protein n=1 Tax=Araneus ventricosus TaxID=182803 RepID=A0A4Y2LPW8_ARAVE|nr:hypothetical protein AVEN_80408-1 [Araneus ventricosus]